MLFVVTDGEWENDDLCDSVITRLNKDGVLTSVVFMGDYRHLQERIERAKLTEDGAKELKKLSHNALVFKAVTEPKHILELATKLVKSKIGK